MKTDNNIEVMDLNENELLHINGGVAWAVVGKVALRVVVAGAGVATGVGIAVGVGLLAYEIFK